MTLTLRTYDGNGRIPIPDSTLSLKELERLEIAARIAERRADCLLFNALADCTKPRRARRERTHRRG